MSSLSLERKPAIDGNQWDSFAWLLAPLTEENFLITSWERQPLILHRNDPRYYELLLSYADLDRLATSWIIPAKNIRAVKGDSHLPSDAFASTDGMANMIEVMRYFDQGFTVIFDHAHRYSDSLALLCRSLNQEIGYNFQTNLYLTPSQSRGFNSHYDTHDVFVLQVHGRKKWSVYQSPIQLPFRGQTHDSCSASRGEESLTETLEPGDLLYIPRGYFHEAGSQEDLSLHITLGVHSETWADVFVESVAIACAQDPSLRKSIPARLFRSDVARKFARARFEELWRRMQELVDIDERIDQIVEKSAQRVLPNLTEHMLQVAALRTLCEDSLVQARKPCSRFSISESSVTVIAFENEIIFPLRVHDALRAVLSGQRLRVGDIDCHLNDEAKTTLVRRLILEGLLHIVQNVN